MADNRIRLCIRFRLDGCDISFIAEAPADMTLAQLLKQADRIHPDWCACGICSELSDMEAKILFDYDDVKKAGEDVSCSIYPDESWRKVNEYGEV